MKWLFDELKSGLLIICVTVIVCFSIYAVTHRYTSHTAYKQTVIFDNWSGKVTVEDVSK